MTNSMSLPRRFTTAETAAELGMSKATVEREITAGRLGCYRLGPRGKIVRVGEHHILEYLACREAKTPSESATTSLASAPTAANGVPAGTIHVLDRPSAVASALATFAPRSSNLPGSSPSVTEG